MDVTALRSQARDILQRWKGEKYVFGLGCARELGRLVHELGTRALVVMSGTGATWSRAIRATVTGALAGGGTALEWEVIPGAAPNAPVEDVQRLAEVICTRRPEVVVVVGGGSNIDAVKAAVALVALGDQYELDTFFGVNQVTEKLQATQRKMLPIVAMQVAAGSAAHLTRYSNITNMQSGQKLLIVDDAMVPTRSLFDYGFTTSMPGGFTMDGGLDGVSHCLEVLEGIPAEKEAAVRPACLLGIELIVRNLKAAVQDPTNLAVRELMGLGTDLGGYAIMVGGTSGAHLNSFSLVDLLSHGRACALMNPYYTVFFAPAIEERLRAVGSIYRDAGYLRTDLARLHGRDLGVAVAEGMIALAKDIGFPTRLREVPGFTPAHVARCLAAAQNPKLESKLRNRPVPLTAAQVDEYMGPILQAAQDGDLTQIRNLH